MARVDLEIDWYVRSARRHQFAYKGLKALSIVSAASIPIIGALNLSSIFASVLGGVIVVSEGIQQLNRHHENWLAHGMAAGSLRREKALFVADGGPYSRETTKDPVATLAERAEEIISREAMTWHDLEHQQASASSPATASPKR